MSPWIDRIYYGAVLSGCFGMSIWAVRRMMVQAAETMALRLDIITTGQAEVKVDLREMPEKLENKFNNICTERQNACGTAVNRRLDRLEHHGHKGLNANGGKVTIV